MQQPQYESGFVTLNVGMYSNLVVPVGRPISEAVAWLALVLDVPEDVLMHKLQEAVLPSTVADPTTGASRPAQRRSAPAQRRSGGSTQEGTGAFCPQDEQVELWLTKEEWQEYEFGPDGEELPQKFYCPKDAHPEHEGNRTVWRSRAIFA